MGEHLLIDLLERTWGYRYQGWRIVIMEELAWGRFCYILIDENNPDSFYITHFKFNDFKTAWRNAKRTARRRNRKAG